MRSPDSRPASSSDSSDADVSRSKGGRRWRVAGIGMLVLLAVLLVLRLMMPSAIRWYVNRVLDQGVLYKGQIGQVHVQLWRGAYSIDDVRILKQAGNVPVPFFAAEHVNFALEWPALMEGKLVGKMVLHGPELNFVDGGSEADDQTGAGAPWLEIIRDLYPFKINSTEIHDGAIHFRAFAASPPVDVYLSELEATIDNLTNIHDEIAPLVSTVRARGTAMDQAKFEYEMKLDPFSYNPTFDLAVRLLGLDVTKLNNLAQAYGGIDFEHGWFDLVVEVEANEGSAEGYIKPLFRELKVLGPSDAGAVNPLELFWEAVVGVTTGVLTNPPREQFGTMIPIRGSLSDPQSNLFEIIGNALQNAFVRAYLPNFEGARMDGFDFGAGETIQTSASGAEP